MTSNIQVAIAEDHPLSREGFVTICRRDVRLKVIITASNGRELLKKMKEQRPDVVMMDMRMPEMNGLEATEHIKQHYPDIKVIGLSMYAENYYVKKMLELGAEGYLLKTEGPDEVIEAIHAVMRGEIHLSSYLREEEAPPAKEEKTIHLSKREREVLQYIYNRFTTAEIADKMCLSERTTEWHRRNINKKLKVRNKMELIGYALKHRLIVTQDIFKDYFSSDNGFT